MEAVDNRKDNYMKDIIIMQLLRAIQGKEKKASGAGIEILIR